MDMQLPENVQPLAEGEEFQFSCHPGVSCFTDCCRDLDLALSPYDVLQLKNKLGMQSGEFLERYVIIERGAEDAFPHLYLTMVDDGRASCPFVIEEGCRVYESRPGACRMYPVGRGATIRDGRKEDFFVLVREPHCLGFQEPVWYGFGSWMSDQGLERYNQLNDEVMVLLQHEKIRQGMKLEQGQSAKFVLGLYNLDRFRSVISAPDFARSFSLSAGEIQRISADEVALLRFGIQWLKKELFGDSLG